METIARALCRASFQVGGLACSLVLVCMYSLVRVSRRRDIFEDVYGPGVQRLCSAPEDNYTCEEWCAWLRKAIDELWAIEDGNFVQVGALACSLVLVHLLGVMP